MSFITIRNADNEDDMPVLFPVKNTVLLSDLRCAFPNIVSLRYIEGDVKMQYHIICREDVLMEPEGGWCNEKRLYLAVCRSDALAREEVASRFGLFQSYRRQLASNTRGKDKVIVTPTVEEKPVMLKIGHGHFKSGKFSRISVNSLSLQGGFVVVGPFAKEGNTSKEIKAAAFEKFCQQNRLFDQKYNHHNQFVLVYPDGKKVHYLPDGKEEFSILGYRNFLDPKTRFDRLRLYLCEIENYDCNEEVEVSSCSSSTEDLPSLEDEGLPRSRIESSLDQSDSLPLTVEVTFTYKEGSFTETFANNTKVSTLKQYAASKLNTDCIVMLLSGHTMSNDDRLMNLSSSPGIEIQIFLQTDVEEGGEFNNGEIVATHVEQVDVADDLVTYTLKEVEKRKTTDPGEILRLYQKVFLQGRSLDVSEEDNLMEGNTANIFISRGSAWDHALEEVQHLENIRWPLEVSFCGEAAIDMGGPRREFFGIFMANFKENMLTVNEESVDLTDNELYLAKHTYFYAGLIIGLSIIEGGPIPRIFKDILLEKEERHIQFQAGLGRTGILQLYQRTCIKFLMSEESKTELTVSKFHRLFTVEFSAVGSNDRRREEESYRSFVRFSREVFAGRRVGGNLTLHNILKFCTGSEDEPVLGFSTPPQIAFTSDILPSANTCICRLYLPTDATKFDLLDMAFMNDHFGYE